MNFFLSPFLLLCICRDLSVAGSVGELIIRPKDFYNLADAVK